MKPLASVEPKPSHGISRWRVGLLALGLSLGLASASAAAPLKVAFVYVGPVGDAGWSYAHDQGGWRWRKNSARRSRPLMSKACPKAQTPSA